MNLFGEILFADKVIDFSSQLGLKQFSAEQILGKPSVMLDFGYSSCSWTPKFTQDTEWIHIGFEKPINASQISIFENFKPGFINQVLVFDIYGQKTEIFFNNKQIPSNHIGRVLDLKFPKTKEKISSVKIFLKYDIHKLESKDNELFPQIDAVCISDVQQEILPKINEVDLELIYEIKIEKLDTTINSIYSEISPIISADGNILIFTRDGHPENIGYRKKQDVWYSVKDNSSNFSNARNFGSPINNEGNNFAFSISPDKNVLLLGNVYKQKGKMEKGVSVSFFDGEEWSFPEPIIIKNFYNHNEWSGYYLSTNGKVLLSLLERDDTFGGLDIYASFPESDSVWSEPINLGPDVNTAADEDSPFLAADGKTLYFSTSGRCGYGSSDMFKTELIDSTFTKWSEPKNIGKNINSFRWDAYYTIPASGDYAYFVSNRDSSSNDDIYRIKLLKNQKPKSVVLVSGKVINKKTGETLESIISYHTLPDGKEAGIARSNKKKGTYEIILPAGYKYGFFADVRGFIPVSDNIDLTNAKNYDEINRDLFLVPYDDVVIIPLNNIFFEFGKYDLLTESYPELNRILNILNENPHKKIEIYGHTDNIGVPSFNLELSKKRAESVAVYLISKGLTKDRISTKGYGETKPVDTNSTDEGRQKNRRVELKIK